MSHNISIKTFSRTKFLITAISLLILASRLHAEDATAPGSVTAPYPTITNIAVEWLIAGDDNLNGVVSLRYHKAGEKSWREGMPLRRVPAGRSQDTNPIFTWENKHSGSIFDLAPDTGYEIELTLSDPDGGSTQRTVTAKTRAVPRTAADSVVKHAEPGNYKDTASASQPGDVIVLAPGHYGYGFAYKGGEPGKTIVIRADRSNPDSTVTFDSFSLRNRKHVILEGITVNGKVDLLGAEEVAVVRCSVNSIYGIVASDKPGCTNCYIADNVVTYTVTWAAENMGASGSNEGEGIRITGPGNVICYNRVSGYRDCISTMEDTYVSDQYCIDIYNNDIYLGLDDGIEADFCMGNCRIMRNRLTNCFMALSSQPSLGGPTYFIRNVMYNIIDCPFKLARYSHGDVVLHNTVVKVGDGLRVIHNPSYAYFRNNLAIGGEGGGSFGNYYSGEGRAVEFPHADSTTSLDYDGVGTHGTEFLAKIGSIKTSTFEDFRSKTSEKHAVLVDMNVFREGVEFPNPAIPEREPADLRLRSGSVAVDAGVVIPNINDNFSGAGPDLGAYESGADPPHYGPWPEGAVFGSSCDFNSDGRVTILDVIAFILAGRSEPDNPLLDRNGDGIYTIADAVSLLADIANRACPEYFPGLAAGGK